MPHLSALIIDAVVEHGAGVLVRVRAREESAVCPRCGARSTRVRSRSTRMVRDVAIAGRRMLLELRLRRLFCDNDRCPARTFTEQHDTVIAPRLRHTVALSQTWTAIALSLAGRAGARLAGRLGMPTNRHMLIRLLRGLNDPPIAGLRVVGVDVFALRRGSPLRHRGDRHPGRSTS